MIAISGTLEGDSIPTLRRKIRLVVLLQAAENAGLIPIPIMRLHMLAYLSNVLAPVWDMPVLEGKLLKRRSGPFYPVLQGDLDRLVGTGVVFVANLSHVLDEDGRWRLEGSYRLNHEFADRVVEGIEAFSPERHVRQFIDELAYAMSALSFEDIDSAAEEDATYSDSVIDVGSVVDFAEWRDVNYWLPHVSLGISCRMEPALRLGNCSTSTSTICKRDCMVGAEVKNLHDLGPWKGADLPSTAKSNVGVGADSDVPPQIRFVAGVARLVRRRLARNGADADPARPAVFLLEPSPAIEAPDVQPQRVPMLDNGLTPITGRLWFVNPVVRAGKYLDVEDCDDNTLFTIVIETLGLGTIPAIVFDPRTPVPSVRYYPSGLHDPDNVEALAVFHADVSFDRIFAAIDRIYEHCLITPEAQPPAAKLWDTGEKWWPVRNAEDVVQSQLKAGLIVAFPSCTIRHEQTAVTGRLDLEIEESDPLDPSQIVRHAILELKVLRSYGSTGISVSEQETESWVESGVRQAASYRRDKGARLAALCCFDMRKVPVPACFELVAELAAKLQVEVRTWYIYATSEQLRQATTTH
jgi:hypothetical protein